jgi:hypothetical protein
LDPGASNRSGIDIDVIGEPRVAGESRGPARPRCISARSLGVDEERFEVLDIHVRQRDFRSSDD